MCIYLIFVHRQPSQIRGRARDALYQQAIHLMTERCLSTGEYQPDNLPLVTNYNPPVGMYAPQYFYIKQKKPVPMPPLKVTKKIQITHLQKNTQKKHIIICFFLFALFQCKDGKLA